MTDQLTPLNHSLITSQDWSVDMAVFSRARAAVVASHEVVAVRRNSGKNILGWSAGLRLSDGHYAYSTRLHKTEAEADEAAAKKLDELLKGK